MDKIPLKYKDRRAEGGTVLRQCQLVQLHLLYVFDAICRKHKIEYILNGGTLLGAMRHDGFIPWDDDLDVGMMRKDYNKFLKIARSELPEDVILQTPDNTPECIRSFSKLRDAYSFFAEKGLSISLGRHNGIFIDIFAYDTMPNLGKRLEMVVSRVCKRCWFWGRALRNSGAKGWLFSLFGGWLALVFYGVHYLIRFGLRALELILPPKRFYCDLRHPVFSAKTLAAYYPIARHRFEDGLFPVPHNPDVVLTDMYGDWRTLPPEAKRVGEHGKLILPFRTMLKVPGAMEWK